MIETLRNNYYSFDRTEMLEFIPQNCKKVLEIGCSEGNFGRMLKDKFGMEVWGIELNEKAAGVASKILDKVLIGDITTLIDSLANESFDCIVLNDILEHLSDPWEIMIKAKTLLKKDGCVVCSIPNIWHYSVLKDLLVGKNWQYDEAGGILDKTHLRFFTKKSLKDFFESTGYQINTLKGINGTSSIRKFWIWNILSLGYFSDAQYSQFACVVKPKGL